MLAYCNSYFSKFFYVLTQFIFGQLNDEGTASPILQPRKLRRSSKSFAQDYTVNKWGRGVCYNLDTKDLG